MLQFIMEQNVLLYVLAAACTVGVISQMILRHIYEKLIKDTKNTGEPEGKFLQQLRQRFQYCRHLNDKVGDVQALIQKNMMEYRFWGMNLHQWMRAGVHCLAVSLGCAFAGAMFMLQAKGTLTAGSLYLWMGAGAAAVTAAAYGIADIKYRKECLAVRLTDYLENSGAVRTYSEADVSQLTEFEGTENRTLQVSDYVTAIVPAAESRKSRKRARAEAAAAKSRAQKEKQELKENLARIRAGIEETAVAEREKAEQAERDRRSELLRQIDPKEQERILREVLKEFLS